MQGPSHVERVESVSEVDLNNANLPSRRRFLTDVGKLLPAAAGLASIAAAFGAVQAGIESREHYIEGLKNTGSMNFPKISNPDPTHGKEEMVEGDKCLKRARAWGFASFGAGAAAIALSVRNFLKENT